MDFMDWNLWSWTSDREENRVWSQPERPNDFYFGYGFDVIEENALNEKFCIQVLRILITNEDSEIDKLEKDLISLQSELAWIENDEWSEMCCNSLREKIDFLDISIKSLMNMDKNDVEVHLLMHTKPVETLNEILKDLLNNNLCKKDEQLTEINGSINTLDENKKRNDCNSKVVVRAGMKDLSSTSEDDALHPSLKLLDRTTRNLEVKLAKTTKDSAKGSNPHSMEVAASESDEEILSSNCGPKNPSKGEGRKHSLVQKDKRIIQNSGSNSAGKGRFNVEKIKLQPQNGGIGNTISDDSMHAYGNCDKKRKLSDLDLSIESEIEEQSSISSTDVSLDSSMKLEAKQIYLKRIKLSNAIVKGSDLSAGRHATGDFNKMKNLHVSYSEVPGNTVQCSDATGKRTFNSSVNREGKGHPVKHEHPDFLKNVSAQELRRKADIRRRKGLSHSGFGNSGNLDISQKLCNFSLKAARKQFVQESKVAPAEEGISLNASLKLDQKQKCPLQTVKIVQAALTETENCALTSLLEQQEENATSVQHKEEEKTSSEVRTSKLAADDQNSKLNSSVSLHKERWNRSMKPNPLILQAVGISTAVVDSNSSFISKAKKCLKSSAGLTNLSPHQDCKGTRELFQSDEFEVKKIDNSFNDSTRSGSLLQKERKRKFSLTAGIGDISIQVDFSGSNEGSKKDDLSVIESSSSDHGSESEASLPSASTLEKMKLADLRHMAKQHNLNKYYKLSKKAIIEQLADRIENF